MPDPGRTFTRNWLHFGRILRGLGFDAGPARMLPFLSALTVIDMARFDDLRTVVRIHFARRREELAILDRALAAFLKPGAAPENVISSSGSVREEGMVVSAGRQLKVLDDMEMGADAEEQEIASYSKVELLRHKDFDALNETEMAEVRRLIRMMRLPAGLTRSRRMHAGGQDRLDMRRLLRRSLRFDGELLIFSWKSRSLRPRPLVLLCDISGSMERYSRLLLNFAYALKSASTRVEAFVFATRLTRITRMLRHHDVDTALNRVAASVEDWSGGTRIGEAIETFNRRYARRVLSHGATVAIISDGWDRGDVDQMRHAIAHLQRSCHRLIWMNPLMGAPGYEPLTLGLQAALPFVDDFLPAHNLANLEALGALLLETASRRPVRRQTLLAVS
ncbi:MAG TPA: VWA domain-containing protein [Candidatus Acidoferrum sp.]|nr:VWA domain-containing protein [Candidatus Acidoferrum sp.]